ncbi:hypothetical protein AB0P00_15980 [Microbacterium sp. NPDC077057]|uniref:hypothetical protein n=1 Tax=Microbacterium sp. NPDC077057 TaxID=3154763 RepID=UPI003425BDD5
MSTTKKTQPTAPLAHRVPAEVSDLIATYSAWLEEQTGVKIDPMSVYLGSQLRSTFQKSDGNQARIAKAAQERAARDAAKAERKAEREAEREAAAKAKTAEATKTAKAPAPKKASKPARKKGATVATKQGVVIAEQRHIDATKEA